MPWSVMFSLSHVLVDAHCFLKQAEKEAVWNSVHGKDYSCYAIRGILNLSGVDGVDTALRVD